MGNSNLGASGASGDQMTAFDKLPPSFRAALRDADHNWASTTPLSRHRKSVKGYRNPSEFLKEVRRWDKIEHDRLAKKGLVAPGQR
jgi:hypothetical protein